MTLLPARLRSRNLSIRLLFNNFRGKGVFRVLTIAEDVIKLIGDLIPLVLPLLGL
ncbi:hypothetical protein ACFXO9_09685 [Nocardia tengchongensis]|uniref:hypothetical protein n=1 Tax=Nocardia tengchongensis TaxID=2055889 RepID=UPI00368BCCD7